MFITSQSLGQQNHWDHAGIGASFLCVLHCLLTPFLIMALPALAATEHQTHSVFVIIILLFGMLAFIPGYIKHHNKSVPLVGIMGVSMITLAAVLPEVENAEMIETGLVLVGGIALISAHLRNAYWCRFCSKCSDTCCDFAGEKKDSPVSL
ncbi:MAG: MerC domain-containing protein [Gammaproteobacteria bacterium]|nr:MerC domain-containing protein [Gammaproteobacteria bacterium]